MREQDGAGAGTSDAAGETGRPDSRHLSTADIASATRAQTTGTGQESAGSQGRGAGTESSPLFDEQEAQTFQDRWMDIQTGFVDEPRRAVEQADNLVAEIIQRLAEIFAEERNELEGQWGRGDQVSTEDLRLALQRYRSFFSRLLSIERPT